MLPATLKLLPFLAMVPAEVWPSPQMMRAVKSPSTVLGSASLKVATSPLNGMPAASPLMVSP